MTKAANGCYRASKPIMRPTTIGRKRPANGFSLNGSTQPGAVNGQRLLGGIAYTTSTARDENSPSLLSFEA